MSEDFLTGDDRPDESDQPIAALACLDQNPSPGFWLAIRRKIDRRLTTVHFATFSWQLPKLVLVEFMRLTFGLLDLGRRPKGGSQ
jgi:hypothetical protein